MKRSKLRKQIRRLQADVADLQGNVRELQRDFTNSRIREISGPSPITAVHIAPIGNGYTTPPLVAWEPGQIRPGDPPYNGA